MKYNIISDAVSPLRVLCRKICIGVLAVGFTIVGTSCDDDDNNTFDYGSLTPPAAVYSPEVTQTMQNLWATSSALDDKDSRTAAYAAIQAWADDCPADEIYMRYRDADTPLALAIQNIYPALQCYDMAFDRVLNALKAGMPADGKPRVWALYNRVSWCRPLQATMPWIFTIAVAPNLLRISTSTQSLMYMPTTSGNLWHAPCQRPANRC